jgi:hypothetical protein
MVDFTILLASIESEMARRNVGKSLLWPDKFGAIAMMFNIETREASMKYDQQWALCYKLTEM